MSEDRRNEGAEQRSEVRVNPGRRTMEPGKPETWPREIGGQEGPEPTRYGDWEKGGRCTDF